MPSSLQSLLQLCFLALSEVAPYGFISMDPGDSVLSGTGGAHTSPKCGGGGYSPNPQEVPLPPKHVPAGVGMMMA